MSVIAKKAKKLVRVALTPLPDKTYLSFLYRLKIGKKLNWDDPKTFNEKLQWLKLYNRKPEYTRMVDKYEAKDYVAGIIGKEHIIPTLGVWEKFDDIDFSALPDKFVLKCTHDWTRANLIKMPRERRSINHCAPIIICVAANGRIKM